MDARLTSESKVSATQSISIDVFTEKINIANQNTFLTLSGRCENSMSIVVLISSTSSTETSCLNNLWSLQLNPSLYPDGIHAVKAATVDMSLFSDARVLKKDTVPPALTLNSSLGTVTAQEISINLVFSEVVTGLENSDISLSQGKALSISGSAATYILKVAPATRGTITITIPAGSVFDDVGNPNIAAVSTSANFQPVTGTIDVLFGTNSFVTIDGFVADIAVLADKSTIVMAQTSASELAFTKLKVDGTLDTTFGTNGVAKHSFNSLDLSLPSRLKLDNLDRLVVAGTSEIAGVYDAVVYRFTSTGAIDTSFNGTGRSIITGLSVTKYESIYDFIFLSDNSILAVGETADSNRGLAIKILSNGVPDSTWGNQATKNGIYRQVGIVGHRLKLTAAAQDVSGSLYFAGVTSNSLDVAYALHVIKLLSNGTPDTSFDADGIWVDLIFTIKVDPNGPTGALTFTKNGGGTVTKLITGWTSATNIHNTLARYTVNAGNLTLDTTFNSPTGYFENPIATFSLMFHYFSYSDNINRIFENINRNGKLFYNTASDIVSFNEDGTSPTVFPVSGPTDLIRLVAYDDKFLSFTTTNPGKIYRLFE